MPPIADAQIENHGSLFLVQPLTPAANLWIKANVSDEAIFYGSALVVEPRYVENLAEGMIADGLTVK